MPSQHMLPKGKRRQSVRAAYRAHRDAEREAQPAVPVTDLDAYAGAEGERRSVQVPAEAKGLRLDQYLAQALPEISRSRVQGLIAAGQVLVNGKTAKARHGVSAGETVTLVGSPRPEPLQAIAEDIPLEVVYEDAYLAVVNKPAGMTVHAGAAKPQFGDAEAHEEEELPEPRGGRNSGTLVNALLHHFAGKLSSMGGPLRPGIVHRLDKETSGLLIVAKDDRTHRRLGDAFQERTVEKVYRALVHGALRTRGNGETVTVTLPIGRDLVRRTRMTTRRPPDAPGVRSAVSHVRVVERLNTPYGPFTLVEVRIETGRTHQIRVHLQALGCPVVGDTTYGAPAELKAAGQDPLRLRRNFLHAARLQLTHPRTGEPLELESALPEELEGLLRALRSAAPSEVQPGRAGRQSR